MTIVSVVSLLLGVKRFHKNCFNEGNTHSGDVPSKFSPDRLSTQIICEGLSKYTRYKN